MTIEEIEKEIQESKRRQEILQKELENLKNPKFEKGKWYYAQDNKNFWLLRCKNYKNNQLYYTEMYNSFYEHKTDNWSESSGFKLATKEQIQKILIEVAKKKGFKNGVKYISPYKNNEAFIKEDNNFQYYEYYDKTEGLTDGYGGFIYYDGKWAEIIETKSLPELHNYEGKIEGNSVVYGCQKYSFQDIRDLFDTMNIFKISHFFLQISNEKYSLTKEQVGEIVDYLNENSL